MMGKKRFTVWVHRDARSVFGPASGAVIRNGVTLSFVDEQHALNESARLALASGDPYTHYSVVPEAQEVVLKTAA